MSEGPSVGTLIFKYNSLSAFLRQKFGAKVYKVSLDAHFTCPNRDGTKGVGGCIYCNPQSNSALEFHNGSITEQVAKGIEYIKKRHKGTTKFIAYFQQYTNTYEKTPLLKKLYNEAIEHKDVAGLAISTRPDCINYETIELLKTFNKKTLLWVEIGLQSSHDKTLKFINRGHTVKDFESAISMLKEAHIMTCAHVILGLPNETHGDMMETANFLNKVGVDGVKIHNLHVLKDTPLAEMYERGDVAVLELNEYAKLVADFLEQLDPKTLIHRVGSHSPRHLTIAPKWSINKMGIVTAIHKELEKRDSFQGKKFA